MHSNAKRLCLLIALGALGGCTLWRYELGERLSNPAPGDTAPSLTLTQALASFGPPLRLSAVPNGYVLAWEHWRIRESSIGLSLGPLGADFLALDWGRAKTSGEFLLLSFDSNHQLTDSSFSLWDSDAGGGELPPGDVDGPVQAVRRLPGTRGGRHSVQQAVDHLHLAGQRRLCPRRLYAAPR